MDKVYFQNKFIEIKKEVRILYLERHHYKSILNI